MTLQAPTAPLAAHDPTLLRHYSSEGGRHAHDHAQVLFGLRGTLLMELAGRPTWVDAGCGLVVPAGVVHAYRADGRAQVLVLDCPPDAATRRARRFALSAGWARQPHCADSLRHTLCHAPDLAPRRRLDLEALGQRIDAAPAQPWRVAELAAACCLSPQQLRVRFAQALGQSPADFVRTRRLAAAARLLRQGLALEAVALHVGYGSASALSAALRREQGTGARALRRAPAAGPGAARGAAAPQACEAASAWMSASASACAGAGAAPEAPGAAPAFLAS